ncbi:ABC transporter permease [Pseudomonas multiresinivorans]|uniref:Transport permease protein n=1 Tax=Pseudomonas multiresinivorans TaxID=95301 RepID=A0A7Z3BI21_9PSED|nr:ABC transporter permease [Pseudomonas multiresinivorans]QJP07255.1 ABC transporter permease [Pseudomonas multiresinivorans]
MIRTLIFGIQSFRKNHELIWQLSRREISLRYSGSFLGIIWSFINPLAMLMVYSFVFGTVFKARWGAVATDSHNYTVLLFVGMLFHGLFAECLAKSTTLIVGNSNYVKKVIFPLDILPWTVIGAALFHFLTGLIVLSGLQLFLTHELNWTVVYLPMILIPFILFLVGLSWLVSALGVYFRDINQVVGMVTAIMMFLSPVFYSIESIPEKFRPYMLANPLTLVIEQGRQLLIYGSAPTLEATLTISAIGLLSALLGLWFFNKTRRGFSDVL